MGEPSQVLQLQIFSIRASIRGKLPLDVGDMLDVTVRDDGILLKPQAVLDRKKTAQLLRKTFVAINEKSPFARMSDEEIMKEAIGIVEQSRTELKNESERSINAAFFDRIYMIFRILTALVSYPVNSV